MASQLAADISLLADRVGATPDEATIELMQNTGWQYFSFPVQYNAETTFQGRNEGAAASYAEEILRRELDARLEQDWHLNLESDPHLIYVDLALEPGAQDLCEPEAYFLIDKLDLAGWTSDPPYCCSLPCCSCAGRCMILRLANAARALRRPSAPDYRLEGAREVRLAGRAFQAMRHPHAAAQRTRNAGRCQPRPAYARYACGWACGSG